MSLRIQSIVQRVLGKAVWVATLTVASRAVWPAIGHAQSVKGGNPSTVAADQLVADELGVPVQALHRLQQVHGMSNEDIQSLPRPMLDEAIWKLDHPKPDYPGEWATFRSLQQQDETGTIPDDGLTRAIAQLQALKAQLAPRARAAGVPVGGVLQGAAAAIVPLTAEIDPGGWTCWRELVCAKTPTASRLFRLDGRYVLNSNQAGIHP